MIELIRVTKQYSKGGIKDVSLRVGKGEWVNIVGRSGAGKTTLLRMVYAEVMPDVGEVIVGDYRLSSMRQRDIPAMRRQLGIVDQDLALIQDRTVYENVMLVGEVVGWTRRQSKAEALKVLNRVGLYRHLDSYPSQLSFGEQRRLAIARALVGEPRALVADEPLGSLDIETAGGILGLLSSIHARGTALLMTTHQPELFEEYPVRTVRIDRGQLVGER
ncbi:MAG: ATP-binding cassette domain-containing protein [bacterium]